MCFEVKYRATKLEGRKRVINTMNMGQEANKQGAWSMGQGARGIRSK